MAELSPLMVSIIGLCAFFVLMAAGMPIAFAFAATGTVGIILLKGLGPALNVLGSSPFVWASNKPLLALPLFILMGQIVYQVGISRDLYEVGDKWVGRLPGGLALATTAASTAFAAVSGVSAASVATMASVSYPEMIKYKYDRKFATGCIAAGGSVSSLIPPSGAFIIYGVLTETSVSKLFIAGILPGLLLAMSYFIYIYAICRIKPQIGPRGERYSWKVRLKSFKRVAGVVFLFALVMGGLFAGIFTPTEAGAIGASGACVFALATRQMTWKRFVASIRSSIVVTCFILTITIGAMIFTNFVTIAGFSSMFGGWIQGLSLPPWLIVVVILAIYIPLGCVMDALSIILLTVPIVFPIVMSLGYDPIWFGILVVLVSELGLLTPPVGLNSFIVHGVTKVPLGDVFKGVAPFFGLMVLVLIILFVFPQISLFLPGIMQG